MTTMRVRLLMLITDLEVGGVPLHLLRLATALPADRFETLVVSLAALGPVGTRLQQAGIAVHVCHATGPRDLAALMRLHRHIRDYRPHVLHAFLLHANLAARFVGPLAGIPPRRILCEIQTVERERRWHLRADGLTCRLCRFTAGNSPSVVAHLHRAAHIPRSRLRLMPGGVDADAFASATPVDRGELGIPTDETMILWVGRLDPVKGLDDLIHAATLLRTQRRIRLLLVGAGEHEAAVRHCVSRYGAASFVHLLGRRDDVPSLLAAADIFTLPSYTEGLPNALMEAMAAGKPAVATDVPGCRDLIRHGETGLLVPPHNAAALRDALAALCDDAALRRRLGAAARRWVREHHDWSKVVRAWADVYETVAAS